MPRKQPEKDYYVDIKERLGKLFKDKGTETYFEITAEGTFSNAFKSKLLEVKKMQKLLWPILKDLCIKIIIFLSLNLVQS